MKRIGLIAVLAALAAASAHAQQQYEPAVPKGLPDSRVEPPAELAQPPQSAAPQSVAPRTFEPKPVMLDNTAPQLVMSPRHRNDADARQCLRFTSNIQVLRCAERYRPHGGHVTVAKASVKRSTTSTNTTTTTTSTSVSRADRAKASDVAKPDMSQASEPAKTTDMKAAAAPAVTMQKPAVPAKSAAPEKSGAKGK